ncbi:hypothetical protein CXB49_17865 [Chromobacterium sp. ATCC 53434]|nr:hypothetical protein CXB49_17865 [Chromobacterium sp. ATCC 53434]
MDLIGGCIMTTINLYLITISRTYLDLLFFMSLGMLITGMAGGEKIPAQMIWELNMSRRMFMKYCKVRNHVVTLIELQGMQERLSQILLRFVN